MPAIRRDRDAPAARRAARDRGAHGLPAARDAAGLGRARTSARCAAPGAAIVSLYARGRDYHKVLRQRLQALASRIEGEVGAFGYRVATDSAPVLEVELARKAGLGWRGKHTLLLSQEAGSTFFLGEILTDLPLPVDAPTTEHCGTCTRCIDICPTQAITGAVPARRAALHLVPDDRAAGLDSGGAAAADRQPRLRLRRLPARVPVEQVRAHRDPAGLRRAQWAGPCDAGGTVRLDRRGVRRAACGLGDPAHRLRALAAQHRGRARQRPLVAAMSSPRCAPAPTIRTPSCASMSRGRSRATPRARAVRRSATAAASPSPPVSGT